MEPGNENDAPPTAPVTESAIAIRKKLASLLSCCVRENATSRQKAHSRLFAWIESSPVETIEEILSCLLRRAEASTSSRIRTVAETLLPLIFKEFPNKHDEITEILLSRLYRKNVGRVRAVDLLAESTRICPTAWRKIIPRLFKYSGRDEKGVTILPLAGRLLKGASEEFIQEALDAVLDRWNDSLPSVRSAAAEYLALFAETRPERRESVMSLLFRGCNDRLAAVRSATVESLDKVFEAVPEKASEIITKILDLCDDRSHSVRKLVLQKLHRYVDVCPEMAEEIYVKAFSLSSDKQDRIRIKAMEFLVKLVNFCPEKADEVAAVLLARCSGRLCCSRSVCLMGELVSACSRQRSVEIADVLIHCCRNSSEETRTQALKHLGKMIHACPGRAEQIAEIIVLCSKNQGRQLSYRLPRIKSRLQHMAHQFLERELFDVTFSTSESTAVTQLRHVAAASPSRAEEILSFLLQTCEDECEERRLAAISQLGGMAEALSDKVEQIAGVVLRFCKDEGWLTRIMAVVHLSKLAAVHTGNKEAIVNALLQACKDEQSTVRVVAIGQLPRAMQACPEKARRIFSALLTKYACGRWYEVMVAKAQLEAALAACPDIAINVLETLMAYKPAKTPRLM